MQEMIKAIIVEDEEPALERLQNFIESISDLNIVAVCRSGQHAAEKIDDVEPDLVFLDINLPDFSGIDLFHLIKHKPLVIFTTAYNQYAIKAFEIQAIDYLLKPFPRERFEIAVDRARKKLQEKKTDTISIQKLLDTWKPQSQFLSRIPSRIGDKIYILTDDQIVFTASENKMVFAHTQGSKYLINYTLEELQTRLDPEKFFRIHRSTIVNLNYVDIIESWFAGGYKMRVKDNKKSELIISRSAGKMLRQKLGW
jgi:two-component system LytT family response regulator